MPPTLLPSTDGSTDALQVEIPVCEWLPKQQPNLQAYYNRIFKFVPTVEQFINEPHDQVKKTVTVNRISDPHIMWQ
jgi:hypothetical protein